MVFQSGINGIIDIHYLCTERWGMGLLDFGILIAIIFFNISGIFLNTGGLFVIDFIHTV